MVGEFVLDLARNWLVWCTSWRAIDKERHKLTRSGDFRNGVHAAGVTCHLKGVVRGRIHANLG